jgi:hypothetical protein
MAEDSRTRSQAEGCDLEADLPSTHSRGAGGRLRAHAGEAAVGGLRPGHRDHRNLLPGCPPGHAAGAGRSTEFPRSPAGAGDLHHQRGPRAPRGQGIRCKGRARPGPDEARGSAEEPQRPAGTAACAFPLAEPRLGLAQPPRFPAPAGGREQATHAGRARRGPPAAHLRAGGEAGG